MGSCAPDISQHLQAGERVLWLGQPSTAAPHPRRNIKDITITLVVIAGVLGLREYLIVSPVLRIISLLFAFMLCGILFIILVLEPISERKEIRQTIYAITANRAMVIIGKQVFSQALTPSIRFRLSGTTPETLEIWDNADQARAEVPPMRFQSLADGEAARVLQHVIKHKR